MVQAEGDLDHARSDMEHGYHNWACFSAQQAAEKAVKAVFQKMGLRHGAILYQIYLPSYQNIRVFQVI